MISVEVKSTPIRYINTFALQHTLLGLEVNLMRLPKLVDDVITYVSGALTRIFGLNDDAYPPTGTQPYEGEISHKKRFSDW